MAERDGEKGAGGPKDEDGPRSGETPPDLSPGAEGTPDPAPGDERADPAPDDEPVLPEGDGARDPLAASSSETAPSEASEDEGGSGRLGASGAPAALGSGLPPPVGGVHASDGDDLRTDAADPLMPPAAASRAADRPATGFESDETAEDARGSAMPVVGRTAPAAGSDIPDAEPADDPASPRTETTAAAVERRGGGGFFATFLMSVVVAGAVAYAVLWWFDRQGAEQDAAETEALRAEAQAAVAALETRLGGLEEGNADLVARLEEAGGSDELVARLEALDAQLGEVRTGSEDAVARAGGIEGQVAEIAERVDALYAGLPEGGEAGEVADDALTPLRQALAAQDERLSEIAARLDELSGGGVGEEVSALREELSGQIATLGEQAAADREALRGEIASAEEARGSLEGEVEALRADLDGIRSTLENQQSRLEEEVAAARAEADADAAQARAEAVLARMTAAIEAGTPYDAELTELLGLVETSVPATLINEARVGVPSLPDLRRAFPEAARQALVAAPADEQTGRVEGFFRRQLGVRSLEAQEGGGADAVLSRAEAALDAGDLEAALAELEALPAEAREPLEPWIADASARVTIQGAATDLASQLEAG